MPLDRLANQPRLTPRVELSPRLFVLFACLLLGLSAAPGTAQSDLEQPVAEAAAASPEQIAEASRERPRGTVEVISSNALEHVPGKAITLVRVTFPPGGFSPAHHHAGSVSAYVLSGTIRSQLAGEKEKLFKAGASFFETPGTRHLVTANASDTEPAVILAIFIAEEGAKLTTYHE